MAKWAVTSFGLRSFSTTIAPSAAWASTRTHAAMLPQYRRRAARSAGTVSTETSSAASRTITIAASPRWEYSISPFVSERGGRKCWAEHLGQLEHPRPDAVPRTSPPTPNRRTVATAAARERGRKNPPRAMSFVASSRAGVGSPRRSVTRLHVSGRADPAGARQDDTRTWRSAATTRCATVALMYAVDKSRTEGRAVPAIEVVRGRVDEELRRFLDLERAGLERAHPDGAILVEEIARLVYAGGKRVRPAFCYWGHRAAGGDDDGRRSSAQPRPSSCSTSLPWCTTT